MPDYRDIYANRAEEYEELVSREDFAGRLLPAIEAAVPVAGKRVAEFGAGTGRVTRLLGPLAAELRAFEPSPAMAAVAERKLAGDRLLNCSIGLADSRSVPLAAGWADLAISGWSICCIALWNGDRWRAETLKALAEMDRVVAPGGDVVIIETLGTGNEEPVVAPWFEPYLGLLGELGFSKRAIRTDYLFPEMSEARRLAEFFFGAQVLGALREVPGGVLLPECTGIWRRLKQ